MREAQEAAPKDADGFPQYVIHASEFPFSDEDAQQIADEVIADMGSLGGTGGIILTTPWAQTIYSYNTAGMYRGRAGARVETSVAIYGDE